MRTSTLLIAALLCLTAAASAVAQPPRDKVAPGDRRPILRLEAGGPTSNVTALAFSPDGRTLFASGYDKVVRAWAYDEKARGFAFQPDHYYRPPIGPGMRGAINALAVSEKGNLLAVGGLGVLRLGSSLDDRGVILDAAATVTLDMRRDEGVIHVYDTVRRKLVRTLRGHTGYLLSLEFAPGEAPVLVSVARGRDTKDTRDVGEVLVWDAAPGKDAAAPLARAVIDPAPPAANPAPSVAVTRTGAGPKQLRVAVVWGDSALRVWNVAGAGEFTSEPAGRPKTVVVPLPDKKHVLVGALSPRTSNAGQLQVWDVSVARLQYTGRGTNLLPSRNGLPTIPARLTLFPSAPGKALDHVAIVVIEQDQRNGKRQLETFLQVHAIAGDGTIGPLKTRVPLWKDSAIWPAVATTPRGTHLAVSGSADHRILVFSIPALLANAGKAQVLHSAGSSVGKIEFVHRLAGKKQQAGLLLDVTSNPPAQLVLNFAADVLSEGTKGWTKDEDANRQKLAGWGVKQGQDAEGKTLVVTRGGKAFPPEPLRFGKTQRIGPLGLLPPEGKRATALLIVARYDPEANEPLLDVYDALQGDLLARLAGHLSPIRSLTVSADGRLLATAADDQTVRVWSLTELDRIIGQVGGVKGLVVKKRPVGLLVDEVRKGSPAEGVLRQGDTILGLIQPRRFAPFAEPYTLHSAFFERRPGMTITLSVRGADDKVTNRVLKVGQGAVEQLPLFSLFLTEPGNDGQRHWLGWHPMGYYEASSRDAERLLGWHFNTGRPADPVTFARIDQYGKEARKKELVRQLVAHGNLDEALKALQAAEAKRERPDPNLRVLVDGREVRPGADGKYLVRTRRPELHLLVGHYESKQGDTLAWQLNGRPPRSFGERDGAGWSAQIELPDGPDHTLQALVTLSGEKVAHPSPLLPLLYQPPAPTLEFAGAPTGTVKEKAFPLELTLRPGADGVPVRVTVTQEVNGKKKAIRAQTYPGKVQKVSVPIALEAGPNRIEVVATNEKAHPKYPARETDRLSLRRTYEQVVLKSPTIVLTSVTPFEGGDPQIPETIQPGRTMLVEGPKVLIKGTVTAPQALSAASWQNVASGGKGTLAQLKPGLQKIEIHEVVPLVPGVQTVRFRAATPDSKEQIEALTLFYRPRLPRVVLTPVPTVYGTVAPTTKIDVAGKLYWPKDSPRNLPLKATVLVNRQLADATALLDSKSGTVTAEGVKLQPGPNFVQVLVSHDSAKIPSEWAGDPQTGYLHALYLRPPQMKAVQAAQAGNRPEVVLTAVVQSATPLVADRTTVHVNGEPPRGFKVMPPKADAEKNLWRLEVQGVALPAEENQIEVWTHNEDGDSLKPGVAKFEFQKPRPRPVVAVLSPAGAARTLLDREVKVTFRVTLPQPPKKVEVWRQGEAQAVPHVGPKSIGDNLYEYEATVPLQWGTNVVQILAESDGGERGESRLTVNAVEKPVQIEVDRLTAAAANGNPVTRQAGVGALRFAPAPEPVVWVHGTVRSFGQGNQPAGTPRLQLRVNGFRQPEVELGAPKQVEGGTERTFKAPVVLNAPQGNKIDLSLPQLVVREDARTELVLDCAKPRARPLVHVVIVAPLKSDATTMREKLGKALVPLEAAGVLTTQFYPPLTEDDRRSDVFSQLLRIRDAIRARAAGKVTTNDLVLFYFQGKASAKGEQQFFWMPDSRGGRYLADTALDLALVAREFGGFLGAQAALLDVAPQDAPGTEAAPKPGMACSEWTSGYRFALLRHRWLGKAGDNGNGRLLEQLPGALPKAEGLRDLVGVLCELFHKMPKSAQALSRYDSHLPRNLDIRFRRGVRSEE